MTDIQALSIKELQKAIMESREALRVLRFGGAGSRSRNVRATRMLRRDIARMLTELRVRSLSADTKKIALQSKKA
jgi:ribosomal protein L29